jgi:hypothetical protein
MRVIGSLAAAAAALAVAGCGGDDAPREAPAATTSAAPATTATEPAAAPAAAEAPAPPAPPEVVMVRRAGGVPPGWGERLRGIEGVTAVTRATRAQAMLRATTPAGGRTRAVRAGFAVPLDTLVVRPSRYAVMLPPAERRIVRRLGPGRALLSRTWARLC